MGSVQCVRGSLGLPWSGSFFHSAGTETQASHRQRALFHNAAGDTGSLSDWKNGLNSPVYMCVCMLHTKRFVRWFDNSDRDETECKLS